MAYRQVMKTNQASVDFDVTGESVILMTQHAGGSWDLSIIAPDDTVLSTGFSFDADGQQRVAVPAGTRLRLSGGTTGARAYVGEIIRRFSERIS